MKNGLYIDEFGNKIWYKNDLVHNENGPAAEYTNGDKEWFINGKRHRLDDSAVHYINGRQDWYYEGQYIACSSQKEFEHLIKLKVLW